MVDEHPDQHSDQRESLVDESWIRDLPTTARGIRTRESLVAAARRVFERDGFLQSRLTDITAEAKCSIGTFYTYFDDKEEIFAAVMQVAQEDMLHPGFPRLEDEPENFAAIVAASIRSYFEAYKRNAKLMVLLEQVATINPDFRELRLNRSKAFVDRSARRISKLQSAGVADPSLDPVLTALALSAMVSRVAYYSFALGEELSIDAMVESASKLWFNALGISAPAVQVAG